MQTVKGPDRTPEEEITRMVNEHQLALLRLCFTYLHDRELAKDAVQETFLKAYRSLKTFRYDANEKTWLSRIAINCCRDLSRNSWFRHTDRSVTLDMLPEPKVPYQPDCFPCNVFQREVFYAGYLISCTCLPIQQKCMCGLFEVRFFPHFLQ